MLRFPALLTCLTAILILPSCADVSTPGARNVDIPSPTVADIRPDGVNEAPDSVLYLPLGSDVLVPEVSAQSQLPEVMVGPFELRSETLAGALQLILADYEIPMAFETEEGLTRTITVANLRGSLPRVVRKVCALADLYCAYEDGILVIKELQTFTVSVPPIGGDTDILTALASGLEAITGQAPITEDATRTIIYEATNRTAELAERYFQRIRSNTSLIVFEVYIWEVNLDTANNLGIDWTNFGRIGGADISIPGSVGTTAATPVSIGLPTFGDQITFNTDSILQFISTYGAVKTISQPQITVLSGAEATLRVADTENYVSSLSRTVDNGEVTVSTETSSVDTGFTLTISSAWDNATIYGNIEIDLQENLGIEVFSVDDEGSQIGLPRTTERELATQIRIRPGDSLLIAGLVRENDQFDKSGPGFEGPLFPSSRAAQASNTELVFLLKPKVIVYTSEGEGGIKKPAQRPVQARAQPINVPPPEPRRRQPARVSDVPYAAQRPSFPQSNIPVDVLNPSAN